MLRVPSGRRYTRGALLALGLLVAVLGDTPPAGAKASDLGLRVEVRVGRMGKIVDGGTAVLVRVAGICSSGAEVLEAFVTVSQEGVSSDMGFFPLTCDGAPHVFTARISAFDGTFSPGDAFASAYALIVDPDTGQTDDGGHSRTITLFV